MIQKLEKDRAALRGKLDRDIDLSAGQTVRLVSVNENVPYLIRHYTATIDGSRVAIQLNHGEAADDTARLERIIADQKLSPPKDVEVDIGEPAALHR